jgi:predicted Na+-dependent transporter
VAAPLARARNLIAAYPELAAVLIAAAVGLTVQPPLAWLSARQGIDILLAILVFATAVTIDPAALRGIARSWRRLIAALALGVTVLPALSWATAHLVQPGPLRDGILTVGLAPAEIASVATTAMGGGEAALAGGILIGSTMTTVLLAAPILRLQAAHATFSPVTIIADLALVVALPLALGIAFRVVALRVVARRVVAPAVLPVSRAETIASRTALFAVAALVALIASEVHLSAAYLPAAAALLVFLAASAMLGNLLGMPVPDRRRAWRITRPSATALLLTTSMRDFAIAAALATAAFGAESAAPLGVYGILVLLWGTAAAGHLRRRTPPAETDDLGQGCGLGKSGDQVSETRAHLCITTSSI